MKLPALFALILLSPVANSQIIGSIVKLRGSVSILELGSREAKNATVGQSVSKEASILTLDKSFVQIILKDKTQINLGPNSKMILDQTPTGKEGVVDLLKGMIRTEVVKNIEKDGVLNKNKFYIKTRTAALGIRGTDFQTNYNPENKLTNLITFKGSVAMVKNKNENENFSEALNSKEIIMVESGKFSTVSENLKNATEPVKISPVQYTGLKLNTEMNEQSKVTKAEFQAELVKTIKEYSEISKKEVTGENFGEREFDSKKQVLRPTAGGVVDLSSGIYVPPTVSAGNFNKDLNLYELKDDRGVVDESGSYTPPKGVILDAKKGFIIDPQNKTKDVEVSLLKLNNEISGQIIQRPKPSKHDLDSKSEDAYEKYFIKE